MVQRVARILWRRKLVCAVVAAIVIVAGGAWLLTRQKVYQSSSSVALLPVTTNSGVLPNYPNLISSLIPTYIQLVSSPVVLDAVRKDLPFSISEGQLASDVYGESLSNAAIITIVANSPDPARAQMIAARTTAVFKENLRGNRVVTPKVYSEPTVPSNPSSPKVALVSAAVIVVAIVLGVGAGLIWDRLSLVADTPGGELPHNDNGSGRAVDDVSADERQLQRTSDPFG
jgi:capsular polysaccharide biosynthesis protein